MTTIIGLGQAGCAITKKMMRYPQYNTFLIDTEEHQHRNFIQIQKQHSHEAYETNFPDLRNFFKDAQAPYTLILGGSGTISGGTLKLLETLESKDITVLYIKPDVDLLSDIKQKQERVVFQILQQYSRSNLLKRMFVVSNNTCEKIIGDLTIKNFYDKINELISSTYHMYNVFKHTEPIMQTQGPPLDTAKIATFGFIDKENQENMLYDLKFPREKHYYYSICNKSFEEKTNLLPEIKQQIRERLDAKVKVSYSIYKNNYDQDYIYAAYFASMIQEENYDFPLDDQ